MRKWLAGKVFDLAVWLDWGEAVRGAKIVFMMDDSWNELFKAVPVKKKRGRPAGRKDSVAGVPPKRKIGRPLGAKDKKPRNKANMGRPVGSKNKAGRPIPVANHCTGATPMDEALKRAFP